MQLLEKRTCEDEVGTRHLCGAARVIVGFATARGSSLRRAVFARSRGLGLAPAKSGGHDGYFTLRAATCRYPRV